MNIQEIESIETELDISFRYKVESGTIVATGKRTAVAEGLERIRDCRNEVADSLRERQGVVEEAVEIEVGARVPTLEVQRENYIRWFESKPKYYQPCEEELDAMFAALSEGDEVLPDFARSFTVRKPDGRLISVDRRGRVGAPSPYRR